MLIHLRRLLAVLLTGVVVTVLCGAGQARALQRSDGNDTQGPLDISKASLTVKHHRFTVKIHTYGAFSASDLALGFSQFGADIRFGEHWRGVLIGATGGKPAGSICTYHQKSHKLDHCNKKVTVTLPDAHTVKAVFAVSAVHRGLGQFRFSLGSFVDQQHGCPATFCVDRVPDNLKAWLPGHA